MSVLDMMSVLSVSTTSDDVTARSTAKGLCKLEYASMLSGLPDYVVNYAMAKYLADLTCIKPVQHHVYIKAVDRSHVESWQVRKGEKVIASMAALAVVEAIDPAICPACNGVEYIGLKPCRCGRGHKRMTDAYKSEFVGVHRNSWNRVWSRRYEGIFVYVLDFDSILAIHLKKQLSREI